MPGQHRLYPLLMKPGIKRDGTAFQGDYCTNGQWMRFQGGHPRKMGGYSADPKNHTAYTVNNVFIFYNNNDRYVATSLYSEKDNKTRFYLNGALVNGIPDDMNSVGIFLFDLIPGPLRLIVNYVRDFKEINSALDNESWVLTLSDRSVKPLQSNDNSPQSVAQKGCNAGMRYVPPFLFQWGGGGLVQWSRDTDPLNFVLPQGNVKTPGSITLSNDKVIQGYPLRAGAQSPAVLFWTLNSLVRLLNVSPDSYEFKADVISKNVSIISRLSVVEYDGLFYWPGTDRFFVYNGTVQEVPNTLNLNWFFDNLDMSRRQQVVGVRNQKYGEIWWFHPDKRDKKPYNTRALIYNKRENTWYDTQINRDAAWYDDSTGVMFAAGQNLAEDGNWQLWQHEQGTVGQNYDRCLFPLPAFLRTPVISWASVGPQKEDMGLDRFITLKRIEPDFIFKQGLPQEQPPSLTIEIKKREYAQSPEETVEIPTLVTSETNKLTTVVTGRQMSLVFSSEDDFQMGHLLLQFGVGGAQ